MDELDQQIFDRMVQLTQEVIKYYNQENGKNIDEIKFSFKFWEMSKNEHNNLIKNAISKNSLFLGLFDKYLEKPFKLNIFGACELENVIKQALADKDKLSRVIKKIIDGKKLCNQDYDLVYEKYKNISPIIDEKIYAFPKNHGKIREILELQIKNYFPDVDKMLSNAYIEKSMEQQIKFSGRPNLNKILDDTTKIKEEKMKNMETNKDDVEIR